MMTYKKNKISRLLHFCMTLAVAILLMTGCGKDSQAPSKLQESSQSSTANTASPTPESIVTEPETKKAISVEDAKATALQKAGIAATDAIFIQIKIDDYEDEDVYDFEFVADGERYDVKVATATGAIVKYKMNAVEKIPAQLPDGIIAVEEAKATVIEDAAAVASEVVFIKVELDNDDGQYCYEIDFVYQDQEYEYEINAETGTIIEREIDFILN